MTTNKFSIKKPLLYSLLGLITGVITTSLTVSNVRTEPLRSVSSTVSLSGATTQEVNSPQTSPQPSPMTTPTVIPGMRGMMANPDQHFIVMMIPHHEDAVEMADLALSRAQHPELKELAEAIKTTQTQEIQQMQAWYKEWYGTDVPVWTPGIGMGMMHGNRITSTAPSPGIVGRGRMGMGMMGTDLYALTNTTDFDREFIEQMIPHHQMAIMMSTMVANSATHPEIRELAQSIIRSQSAEIEQMQQWYQTWYAQ